MIGLSPVSLRILTAVGSGVLLALSTAFGASAAFGEAPSPSPSPTLAATDNVITYHGPDKWIYTNGETASYEGTFGVDCSTGTCLLFGYFEKARVPRVEVVNGHATFEVLATGQLCSEEYQWARTTTATFVGETATLVQTVHAPGLVNCPGGGRRQYIGSSSTTSGSLVSGNPCFIFRTCPTPEPIAEATIVPAIPPASHRGIAEPGVLSTLPSAATALTVRNALWAAAMAVILVLLVAFPTQLIDSAIQSGSDRLAQWGAKLSHTAGASATRLRAFVSRVTTISGWRAATIGIAAAAIISSFVDPEFGLNAASVRTFLSILVSLGVQILAGWLLLIWLVKRTHPSATAEFEFRPVTLLIVVVAVVLSRITGFEPGMIFGLVAGVGFGAILATAERARVALIGLGLAFAVSVVAWLGYSVLGGITEPGPVVIFISETLSSLAIAGIAALPIALIPLKGMTGIIIWNWNRWIWAGSYAVGLLGFFLILMPMPFAWEEVPLSLPVWTGLFVAYALVAVAVWAILVRPWRKAMS